MGVHSVTNANETCYSRVISLQAYYDQLEQ